MASDPSRARATKRSSKKGSKSPAKRPKKSAARKTPQRSTQSSAESPAKSSSKRPSKPTPAASDDVGPRPFWSGVLAFGLVSVPVELFSVLRSQRVSLRMLGPDGRPLQRRYACSKDGKALDATDIVRGYPRDDGDFTVVEDDELDALAPQKSREIDLRRFVPRSEIPRAALDRPYVLAPAGDSSKAYHLLAATMEQADRAGIATFVMRGKEYLIAILAENGILRALTMRFGDELRSPDDIGLPPTPARIEKARVTEMQTALAALRVDSIEPPTAAATDRDLALRTLAEAKHRAGRDVIHVEPIEPAQDSDEDTVDIMRVLEQRMGIAG